MGGADGRRRQALLRSRIGGAGRGLLIASLHNAGLATLTHTPAPMGSQPHPRLAWKASRAPLIVAGYPDAAATVPDIHRKADILVSVPMIFWDEALASGLHSRQNSSTATEETSGAVSIRPLS